MAEGDNTVIPPDQVNQSKEALESYNNTLTGVQGAFERMGQEAQEALSGILNYNRAIIQAGAANANTTTLTKAQADTFALMTTQIIGASEAYKTSTTNSRTFESQLTGMWKVVSAGKSTFADAASTALSFGQAAGIPADKLKAGIAGAAGSIDKLTSFVGTQISIFTRSADNIVKLREEYFKLMGASGGLGAVLERSGPGLKNVNLLVQEQMDKINGAAKATNLAKEDIVKYYSELGKIPGALEEQIKTTQAAGGTMDGLVARTRLAAATGRDFSAVTGDAANVLRTYNLRGSEALTFVARMTELNQKFKVEFVDVQGFMNTTAQTFRFIGNEAEGSARMFNKLMTAFKETGLSAKASTDLIQGITNQIGNLNIAQKSFLSAQTGGPGGLVGGFQIEKMLRDGKIDEVFEKMRSQMTRQFGKIVSIDDAASSPQAAAQLVRQREMLKQGPLGSFAKSDAEAQRILDAFSKGQKIDVKELSKGSDLLNKNLETGKAYQDKTLTIFGNMEGALESIRDSGAMVANKIMERSVGTAGEGRAGAGVRGALAAGQREGTQQANLAIRREQQGKPMDVSVVNTSRDIRQASRDLHQIPNAARGAMQQVNQTISTTAQQEKRTGVPAASNTQKNNENYMNLFNKGKEQDSKRVRDWVSAQNVGTDEERQRLSSARTVGSVNTATTAAVPAGRTNTATISDRNSHMGTVKVEPITVKVVVDASGVARVDHTQQVQAAMNLPNGGKTP